jgi:hypothetical protein
VAAARRALAVVLEGSSFRGYYGAGLLPYNSEANIVLGGLVERVGAATGVSLCFLSSSSSIRLPSSEYALKAYYCIYFLSCDAAGLLKP